MLPTPTNVSKGKHLSWEGYFRGMSLRDKIEAMGFLALIVDRRLV
jgi:hypothetical protein